jgi:phosphatidylglycerophosphatase A
MFEILFEQGQMNRAARAVILFISQGAYAGRFPVAPGTAGTIVGIFLYAVMKNLAPGPYFTLCILISLLGTWAAGRAESILGTKDSASIVIDEIAGFLLAMFMVPTSWGFIAAGFLLFRAFDIVKPWPLRRLHELHGGLGVMLDDIGAGIYTNILLQLAVYIKLL